MARSPRPTPTPRPITRAAAQAAGKPVDETAFRDYLRVEQVGGVVLLAAAALALVVANSPLAGAYEDLRGLTFGFEALGAVLDVEHWAADGLLAVFFFVAWLEG